MKRLLLSATLIVATLFLAAQSETITKSSRFSFGLALEAGYSGTSKLQDNYYPNEFGDYRHIMRQAHRPGYSLGVWGSYQLGRRWDLQLGMNYGQWNAFASVEGEGFSAEGLMNSYSRERYELRQSLLRMPLEGRFLFGRAEHRVRPFLQLGIQTAYLMKQVTFVHSYYGSMGQETFEQAWATQADLNPEWGDIRRWQWSMIGGFGVQMKRISLSIQRNWTFAEAYGSGDIYRYYPDYCGFGDYIGNSFFPVCSHGVRQLRQTSLRFSYLLF